MRGAKKRSALETRHDQQSDYANSPLSTLLAGTETRREADDTNTSEESGQSAEPLRKKTRQASTLGDASAESDEDETVQQELQRQAPIEGDIRDMLSMPRQ